MMAFDGTHSGLSITQATPAAALAALDSSPQGLSSAAAQRRLAEFGPNRIEAVAREPLWLSLVRKFTHFFALLLWLAAGLAFVAERFDPGQGMQALGIAIIGVIVINGLFSFWQFWRTARTPVALRRLLPRQVEVLRDGRILMLPADDLVPGDLLFLAEGCLVPADCRLIEARGLRVNPMSSSAVIRHCPHGTSRCGAIRCYCSGW